MRVSAIALLFLCAGALAAPTDEEAEAAAQRVIESGRYQLELPTEAPATETRDAPERRPARDRDRSRRDPVDTTDASVSIATFLWYLLLVVIVVSLILWGVSEFTDRRQRNLRIATPAATPAGPAAPAPVQLADHARLAAAGDYDGAIHALLLGVLRRIHGLAPAWTSREVLYKVAFPPEAREALEGLVRAVEFSHFGGVAASEVEYRNCVQRAEVCHAAVAELAA